jgi:hypothetical protein
MDATLLELYHRHVAMGYDKQMRLNELIQSQAAGQPWEYTISAGTLRFGDGLTFEALDLGSHANPDNSWLWSWGDPSLKLTPANRDLGEAVKRLGRAAGIAALEADEQVSCEGLFGPDVSCVAAHAMAVIVGGELGFDAYYAMPYEHGTTVALIRDARLRAAPAAVVSRILTTFTAVISSFPVLDHRAAFLGYVRSNGLEVKAGEKEARVLVDGEEAATATFDRLNRVTELAKVSPQAAPREEPCK